MREGEAEIRAEFKRRPVWSSGREGLFERLVDDDGFAPAEARAALEGSGGVHDEATPWRGLDVELPEARVRAEIARDEALAARYAHRFAGLPREQWGKAEALSRPDERAAMKRIRERANEREVKS